MLSLTTMQTSSNSIDFYMVSNDFLRSFAKTINQSTISNFIVAVENKDSKIIMYMAGKIKVEK